MDVDAPPSPAAAEPSPDATRPSPMDDDDSDDNDITLDQMREKARIRREASPEALREADQASRMERLKKQRERDARDLERKATELPIAKREKDEAKQKLKELTRQKSALENELRKAREGGVSRSLLPSLDLPEPRGRLPIAEELMAPALLAWDCAQTFNDKLSLCRYSFDDYAHAVSGPENSVLLIETVRGMLRMVLKEGLVGLDEEDAADEAAAEEKNEAEEEEEAEEEDSYEVRGPCLCQGLPRGASVRRARHAIAATRVTSRVDGVRMASTHRREARTTAHLPRRHAIDATTRPRESLGRATASLRATATPGPPRARLPATPPSESAPSRASGRG